jgi:hypothetical protein
MTSGIKDECEVHRNCRKCRWYTICYSGLRRVSKFPDLVREMKEKNTRTKTDYFMCEACKYRFEKPLLDEETKETFCPSCQNSYFSPVDYF